MFACKMWSYACGYPLLMDGAVIWIDYLANSSPKILAHSGQTVTKSLHATPTGNAHPS